MQGFLIYPSFLKVSERNPKHQALDPRRNIHKYILGKSIPKYILGKFPMHMFVPQKTLPPGSKNLSKVTVTTLDIEMPLHP